MKPRKFHQPNRVHPFMRKWELTLEASCVMSRAEAQLQWALPALHHPTPHRNTPEVTGSCCQDPLLCTQSISAVMLSSVLQLTSQGHHIGGAQWPPATLGSPNSASNTFLFLSDSSMTNGLTAGIPHLPWVGHLSVLFLVSFLGKVTTKH